MILTLILCAASFIAGAFAPDWVREFLRGAWGWARGLVAGARAPASAHNELNSLNSLNEVTPERGGLVGGAKPARVNRSQLFALPLPIPPSLFGIPWKLVLLVAVAAAVLGALHFFGQARYDQGVSAEKARWERRIAQANQEMARASAEIAQEHDRTERNLSQALDEGREAIQTASVSHETRELFLALARSDRRLCDAGGGCGSDRG